MVAEAVHSVIDTISQLLLIWGVKSSKRPADAARPFGYGRELYYWSLIVSLVIFILGGCISIYEGYERTKNARFEGNPAWNYAILGIAFIFNMISMVSAWKAFDGQRKRHGFWRALVKTKDPSTIIVLLGDIGDLLGLIIAFLGIFIGRKINNPALDGYASMLIGLLLLAISGFLVRESKSLLLGESISRKTKRAVIQLANNDEAITLVKNVLSIYRSPEDAMVLISAKFKRDVSMTGQRAAIERITKAIQSDYPSIRQVVITPI